jgi:DNA-binding IclR family transcriptional regulator
MTRSLQRGLAIPEIIGRRAEGASLADLSGEPGLHPRAGIRLLKTLLALGCVARTPGTKTSRLRPKAFRRATAATH